jgi:hypothetical protein
MKILRLTLPVILLLSIARAGAQEKHEHPPGPGLFGQPPEYVHVLLNHVPVYGLGVGVLALGVALLARSKPAQALALGIIVVTSALAWPVQYFGENAYERIRRISDEQGQQWLHEHMERADKLIYAFYATTLLGIAAFVSQKRFPKGATPLVVMTLIAGAASAGAGAWISKAGGEIRHPEFRSKAAPSPRAAPNEHGAPEQPHEKMQHRETPTDHKHDATSKEPAEKIPLPDTLEGAWKAIHEHHGQLEAAVTGKKFSDVQSHAEGIRALTKRLVELSHAAHKPTVESGVNKVNQALDALKQSAETGSELVLKNNFTEFDKALNELEQQMKKQ